MTIENHIKTKATITCSKCGNHMEITDLLNSDLRLLCDKLHSDIEALEQQLLHPAYLVEIPINNLDFRANDKFLEIR